jgi:hypothetical protein
MSQNRNYLSTEILSLISAFAILALAGFVTLRADEYRRDTGASQLGGSKATNVGI